MRARVSRVVAGLAIGLSLTLVVPAVAGAGSSSRHPARTYRQAVHLIDRHFLAAVAAAKHELDVELHHARSPGQRSTARARYGLAIAVATTDRDEELVALGTPPKSEDSSVNVPVVSPQGD